MSGREIVVDAVGIKDQLNTFSYLINDLRSALDSFPVATDAGSASSELSAVVAALKSQAERVVLAEEGLSDLVQEVTEDLLLGDDSVAEAVQQMEAAVPDA